MRVPINLSTEPFRRDRPMILASSAAAVALAALLAFMIVLILGERAQAKENRVAVDRLNSQLRTIASDEARYDAFLRQPANAEVLQRSLLLNTLIERKSVSWSKIFSDLESVLPYNVKVMQVRLPTITSHNEVLLDLTVGSQSPEPVIGFLKRLEESPLFGPIEGHSSLPPTQNEPLYRVRLTVNYGQKL